MLRNIPACISPDLMHALMSMGHGDEIVLADADFPGPALAKRLIRADGVPLTDLLAAILPFFPLDGFVKHPAAVMDYRPWSNAEPVAYAKFREIFAAQKCRVPELELVERYAFYERAGRAYAVVMTSEADGNLILKKGPVMN